MAVAVTVTVKLCACVPAAGPLATPQPMAPAERHQTKSETGSIQRRRRLTPAASNPSDSRASSPVLLHGKVVAKAAVAPFCAVD